MCAESKNQVLEILQRKEQQNINRAWMCGKKGKGLVTFYVTPIFLVMSKSDRDNGAVFSNNRKGRRGQMTNITFNLVTFVVDMIVRKRSWVFRSRHGTEIDREMP